jgi:hypothetical protein
VSLAWGVLGLAAVQRRPDDRMDWLEESFELLERRGPRVVEASLLALAARPEAALDLIATPQEGGR